MCSHEKSGSGTSGCLHTLPCGSPQMPGYILQRHQCHWGGARVVVPVKPLRRTKPNSCEVMCHKWELSSGGLNLAAGKSCIRFLSICFPDHGAGRFRAACCVRAERFALGTLAAVVIANVWLGGWPQGKTHPREHRNLLLWRKLGSELFLATKCFVAMCRPREVLLCAGPALPSGQHFFISLSFLLLFLLLLLLFSMTGSHVARLAANSQSNKG